MTPITLEDKVINCKQLSASVKETIKTDVAELAKNGVYPKLTVIMVGENPASQTYVRGKVRDCEECKVLSDTIELPENSTQEQIVDIIQKLNKDDTVHGILVQLPLPPHIDEYETVNTIIPQKDVDGFTSLNVGKLYIGKDCFVPCTPQGCLDALEYANVDVSGKNVVVIGRSNTVGKPVGALLMHRDATVTICHTKTIDLAEKTKNADIIIMAVGRAKFLTGDMIKKGAIIIDVGINRDQNGKLCGDVDFDACLEFAGKISPVPGGIGLLTRANLLKNTIKSAKIAKNLY